ncbi:hypothetical protein HMPREF9349_01053 [Escherichia coli MS 79-10]|nr:hypothetical protein HMPREF9349_01053 [Escherichia coli MS 79-10]
MGVIANDSYTKKVTLCFRCERNEASQRSPKGSGVRLLARE